MSTPDLNPLTIMPGVTSQRESGTNLLSVLINIAFGFVAGLMFFVGPVDVLDYGTKLAEDLINLFGYGQQMAMFGLATAAAPFIVLAPILGIVLKELSSVRSLKSFFYFVIAVAVGVAAAFFTQGYFGVLMST